MNMRFSAASIFCRYWPPTRSRSADIPIGLISQKLAGRFIASVKFNSRQHYLRHKGLLHQRRASSEGERHDTARTPIDRRSFRPDFEARERAARSGSDGG